MIPNIDCMVARMGCKAAQYDSRYKPLWICKGYARAAVQTDIEYIFLGFCLVQTIRTGLVGLELGANSSEVGRAITIASNDFESEVIKQGRSLEYFKENILYYFTQEKFTPVSSNEFLDVQGKAGNKRFRCLEVGDRAVTYYRLILRELQDKKLKPNEHISSQIRD